MPGVLIIGLPQERSIIGLICLQTGIAGDPGLFPGGPGGWWRNAPSAFTGLIEGYERAKRSGQS
jgi:hypothetical protein